jgi:energy-coupling factor transporter ATP-binding protein EcfA2
MLELRWNRSAGEARSTPWVAQVALQFGLCRGELGQRTQEPIRVRLGGGRITAFVGPSGSGKTTALSQIEARHPNVHSVQRVGFGPGRSIVDSVLPGGSLGEALSILSACALGEPRLWIRCYSELSDGERFRARLAKALGLHTGGRAAAPLLCDEFCTGLHRRAAKAIAYNLRKLVTRRSLNVVVATSNEDLLADLQPDAAVHLWGNEGHGLVEHEPVRRAISFSRRLRIERGGKRDYDRFASMHYRDTDELGFVDKIFVLREGVGGEALGIVVYSHGALELALRNRATEGRYVRNPARLNREVRVVRRLVIHPDVRGCGLGHRLVRQTLPLVGTRCVECLASMGAVNPVFEKAGMRRIGQCALSAEQTAALAELTRLEVDPHARDFALQVCRRPRVRRIVSQFVYNWYRATTGRGERRVARQSPQVLAQTFRGLIGSRPVYYLWCRDGTDTRRRGGAAPVVCSNGG